MKQGWEIKKLGEVCNLYQPKTISGDMLEEDGKYLVYGANGVIGRYSQYNHESNEVLLTCRGATCGSINISEPYSWINGNAMVVKPIDTNRILQQYLKYYLVSVDWSEVITGAAQPQITRQSLSPLCIVLPTYAEQEKIVAELDCLSGIIEKKRQQLKELDALAQSIFYEMFGDPVENEKGWEVKKLGEVGVLARGVSKHRPRNAPELLGGNVPLIQTGDIANSDMYIKSYKSTYSELGLSQSKLWPSGTLCITIAATIGKCSILTFDSCFPDSVVGYIVNAEYVNNEYIYYIFGCLQKILEDNAPAVAQKNINLQVLNELTISLFPLSPSNKPSPPR